MGQGQLWVKVNIAILVTSLFAGLVKSVMQGEKYGLDLIIYQNNAEHKIHLCLILKVQDFFRLFLEILRECSVYLVTHMINKLGTSKVDHYKLYYQ